MPVIALKKVNIDTDFTNKNSDSIDSKGSFAIMEGEGAASDPETTPPCSQMRRSSYKPKDISVLPDLSDSSEVDDLTDEPYFAKYAPIISDISGGEDDDGGETKETESR